MHLRRSYRKFAALPLIALLVSCATNPVTGRSQLMLVSEDSAISASSEAYVKMMAPLEKKGKVDNDAALKKRVDLITGRIVAQAITYRPETAKWDWTMKIIDDPKTVNAFCMAGGKMALYTGLVDKVKPTDDELAQVIAHEVAHALSAHTAEKMSVVLATNLAVTTWAVTQNKSGLALTGAALAAAVAITLPNSREAESEADRIGIELAAKAGYDPHAAATLWGKMAKASGSDSSFDFLSTHPAPSKRREELKRLAPKFMKYYESKEPRPFHPVK